MKDLATTASTLERLQKIYTTSETEVLNELYRQLVLDALRFYGAATVLCRESTDSRTQGRIARLSSKSWCDDFLVKRHGVEKYWAHSACNTITHHNLPSCEPGDMADFKDEMFYQVYEEIKREAIIA